MVVIAWSDEHRDCHGLQGFGQGQGFLPAARASSGGRLWNRAPRCRSALCKILIINRHPLRVCAPAPFIQGEDHALQLPRPRRGLIAPGQVPPEPGHGQVGTDA